MLRLALMALLLSFALPAAAQPTSQPTHSLAEALVELARRLEVSLIYDPGLVTGYRAHVDVRSEDPAQMLRELLRGTGLISVRLSSGTFAILRAEHRDAAEGLGVLSGQVLDGSTGRPIRDVHVSLPAIPDLVAASDQDGFFRLTRVPAGIHSLRTSHVGYIAREDTVSLLRETETRLLLRLYSEPVYMEMVEVEDSAALLGPFALFIRPEQDDRLLTSAGTRDAVLSLEGLSGVQADRGTSNLHVQGGDAGDHQLVLDGMPVFEPVHLRGLIGAFSPYALRSITVHRAGYGASLGSHISGVITAEHALESSEGHRLNVHADPLSLNGRLSLGGPLFPTVRAHAMVAVRTEHGLAHEHITRQLREWNESDPFLQYATLLSLIEDDPSAGTAYLGLLRPATDSSRASAQIGFSDVHAAGRLQFSRGSMLYASFYRSTNAMAGSRLILQADEPGLAPQSADEYQWRNVNGQLTYSTPIGSRTVLKTQLRRSRYLLGHSYVAPDNRNTFFLLTPELELRELRLETRPADDGNHITELAAEGTAYYAVGPGATLQMGVVGVRTDHRFRIDDLFYRPIQSIGTSHRLSAFVEQEVVGDGKILRGGFRLTAAPGRSVLYAEPRVAAEVLGPMGASDRLKISMASGVYYQFLNQYDLSSVSPSALAPAIRFWLPTDSTITPPRAYHAAAGVEFRAAPSWTVAADGFFRVQPHLLNVDYASLWQRLRNEKPTATVQSDFLESGRGRAFGGTATLAYRTTRASGWLRAELSRSRRTFAFLGDEPETAPWSEPVALHASFEWGVAPPLRLVARWKSTWGRTWAFRQAYYNYLGADPLTSHRFGEYDLRRPADHRLPDFYQLDLGVNYRRDTRLLDVRAGVEIVNILDRANVVDYAFDFSFTAEEGLTYLRSARVLSPRMLVASVSLAW